MLVSDDQKTDLFSDFTDINSAKLLIEELYLDLEGKVGRVRQLTDLTRDLSPSGTLMPGGEVVSHLWSEVRSCFVHGNFAGTILLSQALAEQLLASYLSMALSSNEVPKKMQFRDTIQKCISINTITKEDGDNLRRLSDLRNPITHYRSFQDKSNLTISAIESQTDSSELLLLNANFAINLVFKLISLPVFRVG